MAAAAGSGHRWLRASRRNGVAGLRLFCLPYGGATASIFRTWQAGLPDAVEVVALEPPGRGTRFKEPTLRSATVMARSLADALEPSLEVPYAWFGHSMGALIAFETARELQRRGCRPPSLMVLSGRGAPHLPPRRPPTYHLPADEFLEVIRRFEGTSPEVLENPELMELVLPVLRSDFEVCETYRFEPGPPLDVPLWAIGGDRDEDVPPEALMAWQQQTTQFMGVRLFSGSHFYLEHERPALLSQLQSWLGALPASVAPGLVQSS